MSIRVKCPGCGKTIQTGDDWAGKKGKCGNCGTVVEIPSQFTVIPPKQIAAPKRQAAAPRQIAPPVVFDAPGPEPPRSSPQVTVDHHHKATGGAFRTGFGIALGCLTAGAIFFIGGCIIFAIVAAGVSRDMEKAMNESKTSFEKDMAKAQEDVEREMAKAQQQVQQQMGGIDRQLGGISGGPAAPAIPGQGFDSKNVIMRSEFGVLRVVGEVTNKSGRGYSMANLRVTLYDNNGKLIDTGNAIVSNIANGQTKSFEAPFVGVTTSQVDKYKIEFENGF
jgi:hypothetical protein